MKKRLDWIDALRGLAIIVIIFGHISNVPFTPFYKWLRGFFVHLFFVISGYLFNIDKWKERGFKDLISIKAKSYLIPFLFFNFILLILDITKIIIFSNYLDWNELLVYILGYFKWILFQIEPYYGLITGSWFLPACFFSVIFLFFILTKNKYIKIVYIIFTMIVTKIVCHNGIALPWHIDVALIGSLLMYSGYLLRKFDILKKLDNIFIQLLFLGIGTFLILINPGFVDFNSRLYNQYHFMFFGGLFVSIFFIYLFSKFNIKSKILSLFGKYSILVMLLNTPLFKLVDKLLSYFNYDFNFMVYLIIELIVFYIFLRIYSKLDKKYYFLRVINGQ